jgi:integrase
LKIATQRAHRIDAQLEEGQFRAKPKPTSIAQAVADYMTVKKTENRAPKTLVKYRTELKVFSAFAAQHGVTTLHQITPRLFDDYAAARSKTRSDKTRYTEAVIIKGFLKWCLSRELLEKDPLRFCKLRKPPLVRKMSPVLDHINLLLKDASKQRRPQLAILSFTGVRSGELQMLRPEDVDLPGGWINIVARASWAPKNRQSRKIPIHPRLRPYLEAIPKTHRPYLFCAAPSRKYPEGNHRINTKHLNEYLQHLAKKLKLPTGRKDDGLVIHSMRHFFEVQCVHSGIPQRVIDTWMGHTGDRSMGSVYYNLRDSESMDFMNKVLF